MTLYKLPDWLGGHKCQALNENGQGVLVEIDQYEGQRIIVPRDLLTEVKPPLPPEPPDGTVYGNGADAWIRCDGPEVDQPGRWWLTGSDVPDRWADHVGPLVSKPGWRRYVPDPADDAPELPWRLKDHAGNTVARVERSDANKDRLFVDLCNAHLKRDQVREVAAVLWAWAAREVEQP